MAIRVGINGFGRIGRNFFRAQPSMGADFEIVAVNDLGDAKTMAHLLKYDSVLGPFAGECQVGDGVIRAGGEQIKCSPSATRRRCRGASSASTSCSSRPASSRSARSAQKHLDAGAKKVVISAPADRPRHHHRARRQRRRSTTASSTTSSRTPPARPTASRRWRRCCTTTFGIEQGFMTTIHAYTNDQLILDLPHKDLRRARAAAINLIPTSTGAARAIGLVLPDLKGKLDGIVDARSGADRLDHRPRRAGSSSEATRRGGQRRLQEGRRGLARGHPRVHRRPDRLDRHRRLARTRASSTAS